MKKTMKAPNPRTPPAAHVGKHHRRESSDLSSICMPKIMTPVRLHAAGKERMNGPPKNYFYNGGCEGLETNEAKK